MQIVKIFFFVSFNLNFAKFYFYLSFSQLFLFITYIYIGIHWERENDKYSKTRRLKVNFFYIIDFPEIIFVRLREIRYIYKQGHWPFRTSKSEKRESNMKLKKSRIRSSDIYSKLSVRMPEFYVIQEYFSISEPIPGSASCFLLKNQTIY